MLVYRTASSHFCTIKLFYFQLFRHGDRAPTDRVSNKTYLSSFSNGLGELSNKGIENTYRLGTFLRERYVDNGFLRRPVLPSQVYFRSKGNNRCLMSASLVASAMFSVYGRPTTSAVPIYTQEGRDWLLGGSVDCEAEVKRIVTQCGRTPKKSYVNFTEYEGLIFECLHLNKKSKLFPTGKSFEIVDSLINEPLLSRFTLDSWYIFGLARLSGVNQVRIRGKK
ncbi:histidine acid phosphatase [Ancylostoma caninum]|uniref:Histidine acid phosphatase n=1 Tax=Ancylostoma caninum TaxID=29170 RepID=A0A368GV79_ANCCA|nr:histidine acid phosphatase [Ancylostoma caninum]